jgi:hypothetical protein
MTRFVYFKSRTVGLLILLIGLFAGSALAQGTAASVTGSFSGLVYDRFGNSFNSVLTLTNNGPTLQGPLTVVLSVSVPSVTVANLTPSGSFYAVQVPLPLGGLQSGQQVQTPIAFHDPNRVSFTPTINWVVGTQPSTIATQVIDNSVGGTFAVYAPGNPLNGTTVIVPAGALANTSDVIQVALVNGLPGPLDPDSLSAGAMTATPVASFTTASGQSFALNVQITMPYDATVVGPTDYPVVFYWDTDIQRYEAFETLSMDRANNTVTFQTKHFTTDAGFLFQGLANALLGKGYFLYLLANVDSGFRPNNDGFPFENFSTRAGAASIGACYGLSSFAAWYYNIRGFPKLFDLPLLTASQLPLDLVGGDEDDLGKELAYDTFQQTLGDNSKQGCIGLSRGPDCKSPGVFSLSEIDVQTAASLITALQISKSPQLMALWQNRSQSESGAGHSVLVYQWDLALPGFRIYDPNFPHLESDIYWNEGDNGVQTEFQAYTSLGLTYTLFTFDSASSHVPNDKVLGEDVKLRAGWPNKHFSGQLPASDVLAVLPTPQSPSVIGQTGTAPNIINVYQLNASESTTFTLSWTQTNALPIDGVLDRNVPYAHIFLNGTEMEDSPKPINGKTINFAIPRMAPPPSEMVVIVSDQSDINSGYEGFLRAELQPCSADVSNWPPTGYQPAIRFNPCATLTRGVPVTVEGLIDIYYGAAFSAIVEIVDNNSVAVAGVPHNGVSYWGACVLGTYLCSDWPSWTAMTVEVPANYSQGSAAVPIAIDFLVERDSPDYGTRCDIVDYAHPNGPYYCQQWLYLNGPLPVVGP